MLVLKRKVGESIVFPSLGITVQILPHHNPNNIKIGITAPREVPVLREEVHHRDIANGLPPIGMQPPPDGLMDNSDVRVCPGCNRAYRNPTDETLCPSCRLD